jgi:hypothetical protein
VVARGSWTVVAFNPPRITEDTKENTWRRLPSEDIDHLLQSLRRVGPRGNNTNLEGLDKRRKD